MVQQDREKGIVRVLVLVEGNSFGVYNRNKIFKSLMCFFLLSFQIHDLLPYRLKAVTHLGKRLFGKEGKKKASDPQHSILCKIHNRIEGWALLRKE